MLRTVNRIENMLRVVQEFSLVNFTSIHGSFRMQYTELPTLFINLRDLIAKETPVVASKSQACDVI